MFIKYKSKTPINTFLIYCIIFHEQKECDDGMSYIIKFYSSNGVDAWWAFSSEEERQEVYEKVLEMIKVSEISLGSEKPPIKLMKTV